MFLQQAKVTGKNSPDHDRILLLTFNAIWYFLFKHDEFFQLTLLPVL
jgi:hypothetical protein